MVIAFVQRVSLFVLQALPKALLALAYAAFVQFEQSVPGFALPNTDEFLLCFEEPADIQLQPELGLPLCRTKLR